MDEIYQAAVITPTENLGTFLRKYVEKAGIAQIVFGVGSLSVFISKQTKSIQTGNIGTYILLMILGIVAGIGVFFFGIL